jgi:DNA-binding NtrC family response regulator
MGDERPIVLLVEDDPSIAQLYSIKLRMDGYRVDIANDAATAGLLFDRSTPDVVCVDSRLPDGSGRDVVFSLVGRGAAVVQLTNDQEAHERPPEGVAASLLKWRTTPADLSDAIGSLVAARKPR